MIEEKNLQEMIERDLQHCEMVWTQFYDDKDAMEALFLMLISHYIDRINSFSENIEVLNGYEKPSQQIEICHRNILLLIERIKLFQQNGYSNDGLLDLYLKQEREKEVVTIGTDFTSVRLSISAMNELSSTEKEEIIQNFKEIEKICSLPLTRKRQWDKLRQYVVWLSGKDVKIAMKLLPLFLKIQ